MSYNEYDHLFNEAQKKGEYQIFLFDIKSSRQIEPQKKYETQIKIRQLLISVYCIIENLEKQLNRSILHKNLKFSSMLDEKRSNTRGDMNEPFHLAGDCFGFTILRNSLDPKIIYDIWSSKKKELGIECDFHYADGYYDTDDYCKGDRLYFRGYCIQKLEAASKIMSKII